MSTTLRGRPHSSSFQSRAEFLKPHVNGRFRRHSRPPRPGRTRPFVYDPPSARVSVPVSRGRARDVWQPGVSRFFARAAAGCCGRQYRADQQRSHGARPAGVDSRCYTASGISAPGSISGISCCSSISAAAPRRRACKCRRQITDRSCGLKMRSRSRKPGRSKNGCIRRDRDDDRRFEALSRPVSRPGRGSRILAWDCRKPSNFSALSISRRR